MRCLEYAFGESTKPPQMFISQTDAEKMKKKLCVKIPNFIGTTPFFPNAISKVYSN